MPLFFVNSVMQGSSWPSQRGAAGLVNSLDHDSLDTMGSWIGESVFAGVYFDGDGEAVVG